MGILVIVSAENFEAVHTLLFVPFKLPFAFAFTFAFEFKFAFPTALLLSSLPLADPDRTVGVGGAGQRRDTPLLAAVAVFFLFDAVPLGELKSSDLGSTRGDEELSASTALASDG